MALVFEKLPSGATSTPVAIPSDGTRAKLSLTLSDDFPTTKTKFRVSAYFNHDKNHRYPLAQRFIDLNSEILAANKPNPDGEKPSELNLDELLKRAQAQPFDMENQSPFLPLNTEFQKHQERGDEHMKNGEYDLAIKEYKEGFHFLGTTNAYKKKAEHQLAQRQYDRAATTYLDAMMDLTMGDNEWLDEVHSRGAALFNDGNQQGCQQFFREFLTGAKKKFPRVANTIDEGLQTAAGKGTVNQKAFALLEVIQTLKKQSLREDLPFQFDFDKFEPNSFDPDIFNPKKD